MHESNISEKPERVRTYFSHSYRAEDKLRNLFFWELFSDEGFYFTVDRKPEIPTPMYISYLEWLMRRSTCFIAVMPRRYEPDSPYNCSRYQIFENGLAVRARKPRLVFAEDGLPEYLFRGLEEEVCFFHPTKYKEQEHVFRAKAARLIKKARAYVTEIARPRKPIGLLVDHSQGIYTPEVIKAIERTVRQCRYQFGDVINPYVFSNDYLFALEVEQFEVLISEMRQSHVPLDVFAYMHGRCIPAIRICHLKEGETAEQIAKVLHLSYREETWVEARDKEWPIVLSGYQLDDGMKPVIFWRTVDELNAEVASRLKKIEQSREQSLEELFDPLEAKKYFLSIGRRDEKVFISNARSQNELAMAVSSQLKKQGVKEFHYKDLDAIPVGSPDWLASVFQEIDEARVFAAILDPDYGESQWCFKEIEHALERYERGEMLVYIYVVEDIEWPEEQLKRIEARYLTAYPKEEWLGIIVNDVISYLESPVDSIFEVKIVCDDTLGFGTYQSIENGQLRNIAAREQPLKSELYNLFQRASQGYHDWREVIATIGRDLLHEVLQHPSIQLRYSEALRSAGLQKQSVQFSFATGENGLGIPFEWMLTRDDGLPICLEHPVRRFLTSGPSPRQPLYILRKTEVLPRVLLVAANTGNIPRVEDEVDNLERLFIEVMGLPAENICKINTPEASEQRLAEEITEGGYNILHFAGHGGYDEQRGSYIQVFDTSKEVVSISALNLKEWIDQSDLRFVYMSTCQSTEVRIIIGGTSPSQFNLNPLQGTTQAIIEARVPEMIGFICPIPDTYSYKMAQMFYQHFVVSLNAAAALYEARRLFASMDARIWAMPMLIQQF